MVSEIENPPQTARETVTASRVKRGHVQNALSKTELRTIVERASTHYERLGADFEPADDETQKTNARIERWRLVAAEGDPEVFEKRLEWDDLDLGRAHESVSAARFHPSAPFPAWTKTLSRCVGAIEGGSSAPDERYLVGDEPIPFEDILAPVVQVARAMVEGKDAVMERLTSGALGNLERHLLQRLSGLSAQAFLVNFSAYRAVGLIGRTNGSHAGNGRPSDAAYQAFVHTMQEEGAIRSFFLEYPVLARMIATCVGNWVRSVTRFLTRLNADWDALCSTFADGSDPGPITRLDMGLSDPHQGGESTIIVHCDNGFRFVYKPKPLAVGVAFQSLLDWCNAHGFEPALHPLKILDRSEYGWMEYVPAAACEDRAETDKYFRRTGALLCLAYVLHGKDFHFENIIASGDQPVLVDLEMLMIPPLMKIPGARKQEDPNEDEERMDLRNSVLGTMMLPSWSVDASEPDDLIVRNLSGLGGERAHTVHAAQWTAINTDRMEIVWHRIDADATATLPKLDGNVLRPVDFVDEIQEGFAQMHQILRENKNALLERDGPLAAFADQPIRFLFRATRIYGKLLLRLCHPRYLRDGADASIELEALARGYLSHDERPPFWSILRAEQVDLNRLDVPYFSTLTTSLSCLTADGEDLATMFSQSGYEAVRQGLAAIDEDDLAFQQDLIRASFYSQKLEDVHEEAAMSRTKTKPNGEAPSLTQELALEEARNIAERLHQTAFRTKEGILSWVTLSGSDPRIERYGVRGVSGDLYGGRCGIAFFLAAHYRIAFRKSNEESRGVESRKLIDEILRPVIEELDEIEEHLGAHRQSLIGGTSGIGSSVYGLTKVGALLEDDSYVDAARAVAKLISLQRVEEDDKFDVVFGAAGAVLGLLALYRETADEEILDKAVLCGKHLLAHRMVHADSGCRAWKTTRDQFRTGLAHGAAGIAHALAELFRETKDQEYLDAALEAFAFERSLFDSEIDNWYRHSGRTEEERRADAHRSSWCWGAAGIGLVRTANLELFTEQEREDVEAAVRTTLQFLHGNVDHPCCGDMGRVAFLTEASRALDRPELADAALEAAGHVVARARARGNYALRQDGTDTFRPGFFQGLSGVGYQLLQFTHPEQLPSILLLR